MTNPIKNAINLRGGFPSGKGANQRLGAFILACVGFLHSCCLHFDVFLITHRHELHLLGEGSSPAATVY